VSNDAARHELGDLLALVQEQMADIATMQKKRATLTAHASTADGTVEVTVNAQGTVVKTTIDDTYFTDFDVADLGDHVTAAAQAAAREVWRRSAELIQPLAQRRGKLPLPSDVVGGVPDLRDLIADMGVATEGAEPEEPQADWDESDSAPIVRRA
jgi:DNA-binding protein YbaB